MMGMQDYLTNMMTLEEEEPGPEMQWVGGRILVAMSQGPVPVEVQDRRQPRSKAGREAQRSRHQQGQAAMILFF